MSKTNQNKGEVKASPKSSTERGQTRTAKDNAWAQAVSKGKYKTLRSLMGAIHAGQFALAETQPTPRALDRAARCPNCKSKWDKFFCAECGYCKPPRQ